MSARGVAFTATVALPSARNAVPGISSAAGWVSGTALLMGLPRGATGLARLWSASIKSESSSIHLAPIPRPLTPNV